MEDVFVTIEEALSSLDGRGKMIESEKPDTDETLQENNLSIGPGLWEKESNTSERSTAALLSTRAGGDDVRCSERRSGACHVTVKGAKVVEEEAWTMVGKERMKKTEERMVI